MSFKRDGDDTSWLLSLQKRRVSELFADDIPEDEALLTKNGRLACLVCSHRPVFDTIPTLAVHRNGKKHLANSEHFTRKKQELEELKQQRLNNQLGQPDAKKPTKQHISAETKHPLLVAAQYSSLAQRSRPKPYERKTILNLISDDIATEVDNLTAIKPSSASPETFSSASGSVALNFNVNQITKKMSVKFFEGQQSHDTCENLVSSTKVPGTMISKPYTRPTVRQVWSSESVINNSTIAAYRRRKEARLLAITSLGSRKSSVIATSPIDDSTSGIIPVPNGSDSRTRMADFVSKDVDIATSSSHVVKDLTLTSHLEPKQTIIADKDRKNGSGVSSEVKSGPSERCQLYLKAISSGWKKARDGSWVKDENAEFDSDEEPPTVL